MNPADIDAIRITIHKATPAQLRQLRGIIAGEVNRRTKSVMSSLEKSHNLDEIDLLYVQHYCITSLESQQSDERNKAINKIRLLEAKQGDIKVRRMDLYRTVYARLNHFIKTLEFK